MKGSSECLIAVIMHECNAPDLISYYLLSLFIIFTITPFSIRTFEKQKSECAILMHPVLTKSTSVMFIEIHANVKACTLISSHTKEII